MKKYIWLMLYFSKCSNITSEGILSCLTNSWPGVSCAATGNPIEVVHVSSHCSKVQQFASESLRLVCFVVTVLYWVIILFIEQFLLQSTIFKCD
jgi:hypothetical protein